MSHNLLSIYLNDHLMGATAGLELARRAYGSNRDNEFGSFLGPLAEEIAEDRETLVELMDRWRSARTGPRWWRDGSPRRPGG